MATDYGILSDLQAGPTAQMGNVANPECDLLCEPYRWPMADAAGGFSALANGVWLLLALETEWSVGSDQCSLGETSA